MTQADDSLPESCRPRSALPLSRGVAGVVLQVLTWLAQDGSAPESSLHLNLSLSYHCHADPSQPLLEDPSQLCPFAVSPFRLRDPRPVSFPVGSTQACIHLGSDPTVLGSTHAVPHPADELHSICLWKKNRIPRTNIKLGFCWPLVGLVHCQISHVSRQPCCVSHI